MHVLTKLVGGRNHGTCMHVFPLLTKLWLLHCYCISGCVECIVATHTCYPVMGPGTTALCKARACFFPQRLASAAPFHTVILRFSSKMTTHKRETWLHRLSSAWLSENEETSFVNLGPTPRNASAKLFISSTLLKNYHSSQDFHSAGSLTPRPALGYTTWDDTEMKTGTGMYFVYTHATRVSTNTEQMVRLELIKTTQAVGSRRCRQNTAAQQTAQQGSLYKYTTDGSGAACTLDKSWGKIQPKRTHILLQVTRGTR